MLLSELQRVLAAPDHPVHTPPSQQAWLDVFEQIGSRLPADYVAFVERYGAGEVNEYLRISTPFQPGPANLLRLVPAVLGTYREAKIDSPEDWPFPLWFEPNGLLPFGSTANGEILFWVTGPRIDFWTVAVFGRDADELERFDVDATTFVARLLTGELRCNQFPNNWPKRMAVFRPLGHA